MNHITMRITGLVQRRIAAFEQMGKSTTDGILEAPRTSISVQKLVSFFERVTVSEDPNKVDDNDSYEKVDTEQGNLNEKCDAPQGDLYATVPSKCDIVSGNGNIADEKGVDAELDTEQGQLDYVYESESSDDSSESDSYESDSYESDSSFETATSQFTEGSASDQISTEIQAATVNGTELGNLAAPPNSEGDNDNEIQPNRPEKNIAIIYADIPVSGADDLRNRKANRTRVGVKNKRNSISDSIRRMISKGVSIARKKTGKTGAGQSKVKPECSVSKNSGSVASRGLASKINENMKDIGKTENNTSQDNQAKKAKTGLREKNVKAKQTREQKKRGSSLFAKLKSCVAHRTQAN